MSQLTDLLDDATSGVNPHAYDGRFAALGERTVNYFDYTTPSRTVSGVKMPALGGAIQENFRAEHLTKNPLHPEASIHTNYYAAGINKYSVGTDAEFTIHTAAKYKPQIQFISTTTKTSFFNRYYPTIAASVSERHVTAPVGTGTTYYCIPGQEYIPNITPNATGIEGKNP